MRVHIFVIQTRQTRRLLSCHRRETAAAYAPGSPRTRFPDRTRERGRRRRTKAILRVYLREERHSLDTRRTRPSRQRDLAVAFPSSSSAETITTDPTNRPQPRDASTFSYAFFSTPIVFLSLACRDPQRAWKRTRRGLTLFTRNSRCVRLSDRPTVRPSVVVAVVAVGHQLGERRTCASSRPTVTRTASRRVASRRAVPCRWHSLRIVA